jgi:hypothetical protein
MPLHKGGSIGCHLEHAEGGQGLGGGGNKEVGRWHRKGGGGKGRDMGGRMGRQGGEVKGVSGKEEVVER